LSDVLVHATTPLRFYQPYKLKSVIRPQCFRNSFLGLQDFGVIRFAT